MSAAVIIELRRGRLRWLAAEPLVRTGVDHGFTLRAGGASRGAFASLNFSSREGDLPDRVHENWRRLETAVGLPSRGWALLSQVHGARVERIEGGGVSCHHRRKHPEADAMATARPGLVLGVLTADCLPVVLAVPGTGAVAIAHAGWRGTKIVVVGFSQGGVMAYDLVLSDPNRFAGLVALSSWLPEAVDAAIPTSEDHRNFPALVVHGTQDPMIPVERAQESRQRLLARGLNVHYREFDMQHEVSPDALRELVIWLEERVFQLIKLV